VIYVGFAIVSIAVAATLETMHLHLVNVAVSALLSLVSTALLGVLLAVYYFDVRVRREGLDMQAELEGLVIAPSP
jgi:NhaP-type Na+/H+ or K+/H+ antiporter